MGRGVAIGVAVGEREDADGLGSHGHQQHPRRRPHAPATRAFRKALVKPLTIFFGTRKKNRDPRVRPKALCQDFGGWSEYLHA